MTELIADYSADPIEITEPTLLIRINRSYEPAMEGVALYEATRGVWRIGERRNRAKLAMAVFHGVVRAVYAIQAWHAAGSTPYVTRDRASVARPGRWEFTGAPADCETRDRYVGKSVVKYLGKNVQNPVVYVHCPRKLGAR